MGRTLGWRDGHFSPAGGYDPKTDSLLVLDVARFKYPPHWCPLATMWEAMCEPLPEEGVPRGWATVAAAPSRGLSPSAMRVITVRRNFPEWSQMLAVIKNGGGAGGEGDSKLDAGSDEAPGGVRSMLLLRG